MGAKAVMSLSQSRAALPARKERAADAIRTGITKYMADNSLGWEEPSTASAGASSSTVSAVANSPAKKTTKYPKQEVLQLFNFFRKYDSSGSGTVSLTELRDGLQREKLSVQRLDGMDGLKHDLKDRNKVFKCAQQ